MSHNAMAGAATSLQIAATALDRAMQPWLRTNGSGPVAMRNVYPISVIHSKIWTAITIALNSGRQKQETMASTRTLHFIATFSLLIFAAAVVGSVCSDPSISSNIDILKVSSPSYGKEQDNYWSAGCGALKPSCILYPSTPEQMAEVVKVLASNNETFAIKSGGHNPNQGFASVSGGPLISTNKLNEVTFEKSSMTVRVGPGNRWEDVQKVLDNQGVVVVGGRIGNVGVGGLVLGGGMSFLSPQYGWAVNNVVEFEVVLANGTIVTASTSSHPNLYKALKAGGNNYGIVTAYTLVAHPQGQIWGGTVVFTADKADTLLAALRDFTEENPDEKASILMTAELTAFGAVDVWIVFLFYDGPTPPPGTFDAFIKTGPLINNCKKRSYYDYLSSNNFAVVKPAFYSLATEMTPVPNKTEAAEVLGTYHRHWRDSFEGVRHVPGLFATIAFIPVTKGLARKARSRGGDMIDLDDSVDRIMLEFAFSHWLPWDAPTMDAAMQRLYDGMRDLVMMHTDNGRLPQAYLPLYMNGAYFRQDYFGRLRTVDFAKRVRDVYDPEGLFAERTGGWKM
ncbi:FAD-binding domain-containing protein [Amniculicola lignicola CBS 123094]|uniref:FAD-binding domain-containing protein n=1 Tax=Amniculicola lignicola CBS 123094 TaxID=1392246 RepID=A0A6A5X397_9PLEO|nr:FAD-binding domain-containing protein [Amniculicola lignicola CBS 123094]